MKRIYLLLAALISIAFSAQASTRNLLKMDFESSTTVPDGWHAPTNESWLKVTNDGYSNLLAFTPGVTNDRSCYLWWGQDLVNGAGTSTYTVQFDFSATAWGNNHTSSEFAVVSCAAENILKKSALNANYRAKDANWLFDLTQLDANHGGNAASASGDQVFALNGDTANTVTLTAGAFYTVTLNIDTVARTVDYAVATGTGESVTQGTYQLPEGVSPIASGIDCLAARYSADHRFDNISVSYETASDYANVPSITLTKVNNHQRLYQVAFLEGEVLHYTFNGGAEQTVTYDETPNGDGVFVWSNNPNYDPNYDGLVEDPCEAGTLEAWTTSGSATSEKATADVSNDIIALPATTTKIVNVTEGYGKTYQLIADNSDVTLKPQLFISYTFTPADGGEVLTGKDLGTLSEVTVPSKGTLELTTSAFGYGSTNATVENNIQYTQSADYNFAHWTDANATAAGFTAASSNVTGKFADYGRYFGYNAADSSKIVYNEIPYFIKKSSEFTDSVLSAPVVFTATPSVNVNLYKGIGLVLDGKKGDDGSGSWITSLYLKVNGVKDDDIVLFSQTGDYGKTSLHPLVNSLDEYLACDNAPVTDVVTGADLTSGTGFSLYRISNALARIQVMSAGAKDPNGIKTVNTVSETTVANAPVYTLTGMRVNNLAAAPAGIYIQNGKKFIKK